VDRHFWQSAHEPRFRLQSTNGYRNAVRQLDTLLDRCLDAIGARRADGPILFLGTDHGTELWEHGLFGHGRSTFWNEKVLVPGALQLPGREVPEDRRRPAVASMVDVWPTVFDHLGLSDAAPPRTWSSGRSWLSVAPGELAARQDVVVAGRYVPYTERPSLLVGPDWKAWFRFAVTPGGAVALTPTRVTGLDDLPLAAAAPRSAEALDRLADGLWRFLEPVPR